MVGTSSEFDGALDVCQCERRRVVLTVLAARQEPVTTHDLATAVVERHRGAPPSATTDETVTGVEIGLHHVHLPKLDAAGLVEYDHENHRVEPTAELERDGHLAAILGTDPALATPLE